MFLLYDVGNGGSAEICGKSVLSIFFNGIMGEDLVKIVQHSAMKGVPERHFSEDIKGDHFIPFCHVHPIKTDAASDSGYERIDNFGNNVFLLLQCLG